MACDHVLTCCSPRAHNACLLRELCSTVFCLWLTWCSPRAHSACRPHELYKTVFCLLLLWCSPRNYSGHPRELRKTTCQLVPTCRIP
eukprot:6041390-Pyramimonas_sp.AAC.1